MIERSSIRDLAQKNVLLADCLKNEEIKNFRIIIVRLI